MSAFTIDRICRRAGVSRGLINHHFNSKDELLVCVYAAMTEYLVGPPVPQTPHPAERLAAIIDASFDTYLVDKKQLRAWLALWGEVATHPKLKGLHRSRYDAYKHRLASAISALAHERSLDVDSDNLSRLVIALIDGLWLEYCLDSSVVTIQDARAACYALLRHYLGNIDEQE